jgi:hypothetical protein
MLQMLVGGIFVYVQKGCGGFLKKVLHASYCILWMFRFPLRKINMKFIGLRANDSPAPVCLHVHLDGHVNFTFSTVEMIFICLKKNVMIISVARHRIIM